MQRYLCRNIPMHLRKGARNGVATDSSPKNNVRTFLGNCTHVLGRRTCAYTGLSRLPRLGQKNIPHDPV